MELVFGSQLLSQSLRRVVVVVSGRNAMPILDGVLFDVSSDGVVYLLCGDGELWLRVKCDGVKRCESGVSGVFCVAARDLSNAVGLLGDVDLAMSVDYGAGLLRCDYGAGWFSLPLMDAADYPRPSFVVGEGMTSFSLDGGVLFDMLSRTLFAAATDVLRPVLCGVHFDVLDGGVVCVATDTSRLVRYRRGDGAVCDGFNLSSKAAGLLMGVVRGFDGVLVISHNASNCVVCGDGFELATRLSEGVYPNYSAVIPKSWQYECVVSRSALSGVLRRVLPMSSTTSSIVALSFGVGKLCCEASDADFSKSAKEELVCAYDGVSMRIGFNGAALLQSLGGFVDDDVRFCFSAPDRAVVLCGVGSDDYIVLAMPTVIYD